MSILRFKKANCKNCYKCIRNCPIKAIELKDGQAQVIENDCVLCGKCVLVCPQNAKEVRNDVSAAKALIASGKNVFASIAPAFIASYGVSGIDEFSSYLKKLGFAGVSETAQGAYVVKSEYEKMVENRTEDVIISSCCSTIVTLIQKYHPSILKYVAHVLSPMQTHARLIKEENPDSYVVFIGPCISKKHEAEAYSGYVDCVLTFDELNDWFGEENIELPAAPEALDSTKYLSRFFPVSGGILKTMKKDPAFSYITVDGMENCLEAIGELEKGNLKNCFIEMSACPGSCINGPSIRRHKHSVLSSKMRTENYASGHTEQICYEKDYNIKTDMDLTKHISDERISVVMPGEAQIEEILRKMGKTKKEDELNCGTCGYATCRDKAVAVYFGKAEISMCLPYMMEKAASLSDKIIEVTPNAILTVDKDLKIRQINDACREMFGIADAKDVIGKDVSLLMSADNFLSVLGGDERLITTKEFMAEYNIVADQTFIYDAPNNIAICIMRDITEREHILEKNREMKNEAASIADKVIEKQMRVIQEIASLLGETTAETKIALTELKNSILEEDTIEK